MFTEGLDRDALKWVREVSELAALPNASWSRGVFAVDFRL